MPATFLSPLASILMLEEGSFPHSVVTFGRETAALTMTISASLAPSATLQNRRSRLSGLASLLLLSTCAGLTLLSLPAHAQRCFTQNGQTVCCDNSGNCKRQ
jgi:hypothetical protein